VIYTAQMYQRKVRVNYFVFLLTGAAAKLSLNIPETTLFGSSTSDIKGRTLIGNNFARAAFR